MLTSSQTTEKALGDAMCEMERVSKTSTVLAKTLDEQRTKLKIAEEELVMYWPPTFKSISADFCFLKLIMKICNFFCLHVCT